MGLIWGAAWSGAGVVLVIGLLLTTGARPDVPVPLLFGFFGILGGSTFSVVLSVLEGRRSFAEMSLARFAAWGAAAGFVLAATFVAVVSLAGDSGFLWNLVGLGPLFAAAGAGSAAGSLALARTVEDSQPLESAGGDRRLE